MKPTFTKDKKLTTGLGYKDLNWLNTIKTMSGGLILDTIDYSE